MQYARKLPMSRWLTTADESGSSTNRKDHTDNIPAIRVFRGFIFTGLRQLGTLANLKFRSPVADPLDKPSPACTIQPA